MRTRYTAVFGTVIAVAFLVLSVSAACGREDHDRIAEEVAREWTMTELESVSEEIAAVATRRYGYPMFIRIAPGDSWTSGHTTVGKLLYDDPIRTAADARQIRDSIQWEFGEPTRKADGRYEVIATASISFDIAPSDFRYTLSEMHSMISILKRPYTGSVSYELDVDTTSKEVMNAIMPLASVRLFGVPSGGNYN